MLAPDESGIKKTLEVLVEWCEGWGVKINVSKSGIMHVRQKRVARTDVQYVDDNEEIPKVEQYRYLGCVVDEHLELKNMVEVRAVAGKKALGAWFHHCRSELGDVGVGVFRKLMSSLVESTMLYGAEIWGCNRDLEKIEQVQMRALRLFFGVGTLHPKVSLLAEMGDLLVKWLTRMQRVMFWSMVLTSRTYDGRLLRRIAVEAVRFGRGNWIDKMRVCWGKFGWKDVNVRINLIFRNPPCSSAIKPSSATVDNLIFSVIHMTLHTIDDSDIPQKLSTLHTPLACFFGTGITVLSFHTDGTMLYSQHT